MLPRDTEVIPGVVISVVSSGTKYQIDFKIRIGEKVLPVILPTSSSFTWIVLKLV